MPNSKKNLKKKFRRTKKQYGCNYPLNERIEKINKHNRVEHPMSRFIKDKKNGKYLLKISSSNNGLLNLDNIYVKCFINKMLEILQESFLKEREYHIKKGTYPEGFKYPISNIIDNLKNSRYLTFILTDLELTPISFLYIELLSNDYDKVWSVCSDKKKRGEGNSSIVLNNAIKDYQKSKRNGLLLEVYNDKTIDRDENDPLQSHIMNHFQKHGFKKRDREKLEFNTLNNLLSRDEGTQVMIFDKIDF